MAELRSETEVRLWLAKRIRMPEIPDALWQELRDLGRVEDVLSNPGSDSREALVEAARSYLRVVKRMSPRKPAGPRARQSKLAASLTAEERLRAEVFSRHLARLATQLPEVVRVRRLALDGKTLSTTDAEALLRSPVPYFLGVEELRRNSLPITDRDVKSSVRSRRLKSGVYADSISVQWCHGGSRFRRRIAVRRTAGSYSYLQLPLHLLGRVPLYPVVKGSLLCDVQKVGDWLSSLYPWWPWDASWFILTATIPPVLPVQPKIEDHRGSGYHRVVISVSAEPWVSAGSVHRVFRTFQRRLLGRENRPVSTRTLTLLDFVLERASIVGSRPSWENIRREWNREQPSHVYTDYRHLRRDYERARTAVISPEYRS